ncbi:unnamed protein product [Arctogadus glacialis]
MALVYSGLGRGSRSLGNKEERLAIWETTSTVSALTTGAYVWDRIPLYHSVPGKHKNQEETQITTNRVNVNAPASSTRRENTSGNTAVVATAPNTAAKPPLSQVLTRAEFRVFIVEALRRPKRSNLK